VSSDCQVSDIQTICSAYFSWSGLDAVIEEIPPYNGYGGNGGYGGMGRRVIQSTVEDAPVIFDATGADQKKSMTSISTPAELDTSAAGDSPSSSANSITYLATLMALLLAIIN